MNLNHYLRIVRASAWYDLAVTWPFALPWTWTWLHQQLVALDQALQLPGDFHPMDGTQLLFANLMGSVVVVWALARILSPSVLLGRLDATARVLFAIWQIYAVCHGASTLVLAFTAVEVVFGVAQWWRVTPQSRLQAEMSR